MKVEFYCTNKDCTKEGSKPYILEIHCEVFDENTVATSFCPYCKDTLKQMQLSEDKTLASADRGCLGS